MRIEIIKIVEGKSRVESHGPRAIQSEMFHLHISTSVFPLVDSGSCGRVFLSFNVHGQSESGGLEKLD